MHTHTHTQHNTHTCTHKTQHTYNTHTHNTQNATHNTHMHRNTQDSWMHWCKHTDTCCRHIHSRHIYCMCIFAIILTVHICGLHDEYHHSSIHATIAIPFPIPPPFSSLFCRTAEGPCLFSSRYSHSGSQCDGEGRDQRHTDGDGAAVMQQSKGALRHHQRSSSQELSTNGLNYMDQSTSLRAAYVYMYVHHKCVSSSQSWLVLNYIHTDSMVHFFICFNWMAFLIAGYY